MAERDARRGDLTEAETRSLEDALELMPRAVRDKLDRVGIKLHLAEWQLFSHDERVRLRDLPCSSPTQVDTYRAAVDMLVRLRCGKAPDPLRR